MIKKYVSQIRIICIFFILLDNLRLFNNIKNNLRLFNFLVKL